MSLPSLIIGGSSVRIDSEGRYCLNDLHKAAGGEKRHSPNYFLSSQQTKEIVEELTVTGIPVSVVEETTGIPVVTIRGGEGQGTFACKELVYSYAMWISARFHIHVIRTFDEVMRMRETAAKLDQSEELGRLRHEVARARSAQYRAEEMFYVERSACDDLHRKKSTDEAVKRAQYEKRQAMEMRAAMREDLMLAESVVTTLQEQRQILIDHIPNGQLLLK